MPLTCPQCGENNAETASMCSMCGTVLQRSDAPATPPRVAPPPPAVGPYGQSPFAGRVEYAGFWLRFVAAFLDGLLLNIVQFPLGIVMGILLATGGLDENTMMLINYGVGIPIGILIGWLYTALMHSSPTQATLGKMALGLKVTDLDGNRITFGRASGRYFAEIVSALILMIGYIMAGFTERKQALHDMIAGTLVVRK